GRIAAIEEIAEPDYSFLVIRDLYDVLSSVLRCEWDFFGVGWQHTIDWNLFVEQVRHAAMVDNLNWCLDRIGDKVDCNAFYWYVMNLSALKAEVPSLYLLRFEKLSEIESLAATILGELPITESINDPKFDGDLIHTNYPLFSERRSLS